MCTSVWRNRLTEQIFHLVGFIQYSLGSQENMKYFFRPLTFRKAADEITILYLSYFYFQER